MKGVRRLLDDNASPGLISPHPPSPLIPPCCVLKVTQFLRLARDCQIVDEGGTASHGSRQGQCPSSEALRQNQRHCERRIGQAAVNLAFASVIQGRAKVLQ